MALAFRFIWAKLVIVCSRKPFEGLRAPRPCRNRKTEAEAIAFVVSKAVGLETGTAAADYIHLYHGNASLLAESLEVIQKASAIILAALEPKPELEDPEPSDQIAIAS